MCQQQACGAVAQVVEPDSRHLRDLEHSNEVTVQVPRLYGGSDTTRENQARILPERARNQTFLKLANPMRAKDRDNASRQSDRAARAFRLG